MRFKRFVPLLLIIFLVTFVPAVSAASISFLPKAQDFYAKNCKGLATNRSDATVCFVFDKVKELDERLLDTEKTITGMQQVNNSQNAKITALEEKVDSIKLSPSPTGTASAGNLQPKELTLFPFQQWTIGAESDVFVTTGYRMIVMDAESQQNSGTFALLYSDDQLEWKEQGGISVASGTGFEHVQKVFPVKGKYYKGMNKFSSFKGFATVVLY
jgi:hypothetical protein